MASVDPGFEPDASLSDAPLPEKTADSFKAMTSGGSTGRPKLIVSRQPAAWDPDPDFLEIRKQGSMLVPGPLYHNGPFLWAMIALFKGATVAVTTRFDAEQRRVRSLTFGNVSMVFSNDWLGAGSCAVGWAPPSPHCPLPLGWVAGRWARCSLRRLAASVAA